jgi:TPR repeat protein
MAAYSIAGAISQCSPAHLHSLFAQGPRNAVVWARALALEGISAAQVCYGRMLLEGAGVPESKPGALMWFRRAAAQGDLDGLNMVGRCLDNGWGAALDAVGAASCYAQAAAGGHAWAQYNLGHLYLDGIGVTRDLPRAYRCYLAAAHQQHARAMNLLGRCCEQGWGTPRDPQAAAHWYRRSAEGGYFRGQYNWASILLQCQREDEAVVWLERAARGGTAAMREAVFKLATSAGLAPAGGYAQPVD